MRPACLALCALVLAALGASRSGASQHPAVNPIQRENALPGTTNWRLPQAPAGAIEGYASEVSVAPGDTLVFATDGVRHEFTAEISISEPPQRLADQILARFGKGTDDALVLVARYLGHR